tara:strand:+ start:774 stop:992 length:219 start_codon:yes stop_codon:yes gene_type:complete
VDKKLVFELGDTVITPSGRFVGIVYKVEVTGESVNPITLYHVFWNDGDRTEEDGDDIELLAKGDKSESNKTT